VRGGVTAHPRTLVARSVDAYRRVHASYEARHGEIFNPVEQARLRAALERAAAAVRNRGRPPRALDVGCGTGNVTAHLLALGFEVVAADVSPEFLDGVERRFRGASLRTLRLDGLGLDGVEDGGFDLVAVYSVLHHVPDYLAMVTEAHRVLRPGGVVHLDHEVNEEYWREDGCLAALRAELDARRYPGWWHPTRKRWQRYLIPAKYVWAVRQRIDPLFWLEEGDIHVWPADHVEWDRVEGTLREAGAEIVHREDYLLFRPEYPRDLYDAHRARCSDMRALTARRTLP
jgi:SAM-dependent methyltransferase